MYEFFDNKTQNFNSFTNIRLIIGRFNDIYKMEPNTSKEQPESEGKFEIKLVWEY